MNRFLSLTALVVVALLAFGCSNKHESITGLSETQPVSGKVFLTGDLSGANLQGIEVRIGGTPLVATTDNEGRFMFAAAPEGTLELRLLRAADGIDFSTSVMSQPAVTIEMQSKRSSKPKAPKPPKTTSLEGLVTAISSSSITLNDARSHKPATALIDAKTVIRKGDHAATTADIKVGTRVEVKATVASDNSLTATEIKAEDDGTNDDNGEAREFEGLITAVSASSITIADSHTHGDVTAALTATTIIRKGQTPVKAADLVVGQRVHVKATANADKTLTATEVIVQDGEDQGDDQHEQKEFEGTIASVSASSITIHDSRSSSDVTINITATTVIRKGGTKLAASDLKAGDHVHIRTETTADKKLNALEIVLQGGGDGKGDD